MSRIKQILFCLTMVYNMISNIRHLFRKLLFVINVSPKILINQNKTLNTQNMGYGLSKCIDILDTVVPYLKYGYNYRVFNIRIHLSKNYVSEILSELNI